MFDSVLNTPLQSTDCLLTLYLNVYIDIYIKVTGKMVIVLTEGAYIYYIYITQKRLLSQ